MSFHPLRPIERLSLRNKLRAIILLTVAAVLLPACALLGIVDVATTCDAMRNQLASRATFIAQSSAAALSSGDATSAAETLRSLRSYPSVRAACIYSADGRLFAQYRAAGASGAGVLSQAGEERTSFEKGRLIAVRGVDLAGQPIGTVYLESDLQPLWRRLARTGPTAALVMLVSILVAYLLASRLERLISGPVIHLAQTAKTVTVLRDYRIRATRFFDDEMGTLVDGFNEMLGKIQRRDRDLERHRASLEEEVLSRTAELRRVNAELVEARDRAEEGSRAKSEFLANMSHEIRTPMNGVIGMTELALEATMTADQRECLLTVQSSAAALLTVINDILDFSKIEAGKLELDPISFDLRGCVAEATKVLAWQTRLKPVTLRSEVHRDVPQRVIGDPTRLRQVLLNLLGNALKFTERGSVTLTAESRSSDGDLMLEFCVRDTGIGIAPEKQRAIFQAFSQADGSMSRRYGGTGLGLTISARLVEMMGGSISVESQPGQGSCFRFTIRVEPAEQLQSGAPAADSALPARTEPTRRLRILLAEDHPVNRQLAVRLLEREGHTVVVAADGREALLALAAASFDIVLMDVQMPVMDGVEANEALRRSERGSGRHTPVVALTANAMKGDRERYLSCGMDGYLTKPIRRKELAETLQRFAGAGYASDGPVSMAGQVFAGESACATVHTGSLGRTVKPAESITDAPVVNAAYVVYASKNCSGTPSGSGG
jgi:two-component system, sensor histidine kinase